MNPEPTTQFRVLLMGGTGQVGAAVMRALLEEPSCAQLVMVNRKTAAISDPRVRQVIVDTAVPQFTDRVTALARELVATGDRVVGASCVGVGSGSLNWTEEDLKALEVGIVGGFARACREGGITHFALLSAVGSTSKSRIRYVRIMGLKEETVQAVGFDRLAIFQPGIIGGNAHTPGVAAFLGRLLPGKYGTVEQDDIGRAFVAEFTRNAGARGVAGFENGEMRRMSRSLS